LHIDDLTRTKSEERCEDITTLYKPFSVGALQQAVRQLLTTSI
jgi:hypothetical protein